MKGPHERLKYEFRRRWECPVCSHRDFHEGQVTWAVCGCQQGEPAEKQIVMKLVDDLPRRIDVPGG